MKRTVAILMALILLVGLAVPLSAADMGKLVLGNEIFLKAGDTKTIPVSIENAGELSVIQFVVEYDSTKLELQNVTPTVIAGKEVNIVTGAEKGTILDGVDSDVKVAKAQISQPELGKVSILWESENTIECNGVLAYLTFEALEDGIGKAGVVVSDEEEFIFKVDSQDEGSSSDIIKDVVEEPMVEEKYTVSFNAGKGTEAPAEVKSVLGQVTIPEKTPVRANWKFLYWFDEDGSYKPGNVYNVSEDKVFEAAWAPNWTPTISVGTVKGNPGETVGVPVNVTNNKEAPTYYSLDFTAGKAEFVNYVEDANGMPVSGQIGIAYFKIPADAKDGDSYAVSATIEKWTVDNAHGMEEVMSATKGSIKVEKTHFSVSYDANKGTGAPAEQVKNRDVALTLSNVKPVREGYKFLGWATKADATAAQYQPGASYTANADLVLYAVWEELPVPKIVVGEVKGRAGEIVEVPVTIVNNPGFAAFDIFITYEKSVMELNNIKMSGLVSSGMSAPNANEGIVSFMALADIINDGELFTLEFVIKESAPDGSYAVSVSGNAYNSQKETVNIIFEEGLVKVVSVEPGDVDGNGTINSLDAMRILQCSAKMLKVEELEYPEAADFDGNGLVNSLDAMLTLRKAARLD